MNQKDREILKLLIKRIVSKKEIAKRLKLSEVAARKRIKNLEKKKIILGYKGIINYKKVDFVSSLTGIDVEPEKLLSVLDELKKIEEITTIYLASGDHMIIIEIIGDNLEIIKELHEKLSKIDGVKRICPAIITEIIK